MTTNSDVLTYDDCLEGPIDCGGEVEYRMSMSPTGISYPRCDKHMESRWALQERLTRDYGVPLTYDGRDDDWYDD